MVSAQPPMQEYVAREFGGRSEAIEAFLNRSVGFSDAALEHAWALRRLAQRYPPAETAKLSAESRHKLEDLIREHVAAIQAQAKSELVLLRPTLARAVKERAVGGPLTGEGSSETSASWPALAEPLFDSVQRIDRLVRGLFAGAGLPLEGVQRTDGQPLRLPPPEEFASTLLAALEKLNRSLPKLGQTLDSEFLEAARKDP